MPLLHRSGSCWPRWCLSQGKRCWCEWRSAWSDEGLKRQIRRYDMKSRAGFVAVYENQGKLQNNAYSNTNNGTQIYIRYPLRAPSKLDLNIETLFMLTSIPLELFHWQRPSVNWHWTFSCRLSGFRKPKNKYMIIVQYTVMKAIWVRLFEKHTWLLSCWYFGGLR